jgi:hypothetical protein
MSKTMDDLLQTEAEFSLDDKSRAAFRRARKNIAKALARPHVKALLRAQREAIERDREDRARKHA